MMQEYKISEIQTKIRDREFTCEQYLNVLLANYDQRNENLNCVLQIDRQGALEYAKQIDSKVRSGQNLGTTFWGFYWSQRQHSC